MDYWVGTLFYMMRGDPYCGDGFTSSYLSLRLKHFEAKRTRIEVFLGRKINEPKFMMGLK